MNAFAEIVGRLLMALASIVGGGALLVADIGRLIDDAATADESADRGDRDAPDAGTTAYRVPVIDVDRAGWGTTHAAYPATDIFVGCGAPLVSPVDGTVLEVRRVDSWDPAVDDPATRGGRSVAIVGLDGVRYYLAHFDVIVDDLDVGDLVRAGDVLGTMGDTGRTSACHLHFGLSPPCDGDEWRVRRGVVWPYPYLDAWRSGEQRSPGDEVDSWVAANPTACREAIAEAEGSLSR